MLKLGFWNMTAVQGKGSSRSEGETKDKGNNHFNDAEMYGVLPSC